MDQQKSNQKIIFVTGKGGVGKSTVAASIAAKYAQKGTKTLLVELGNQSFFKDYFHLVDVGYKPTPVHIEGLGTFDLAMWSGHECLKEYILHLIKIEKLYKIFFENTVMKALLNIAPALYELSILGKITSGIRKVGPSLTYELIVVDGVASGHFKALMRAPKGMAEAIKLGPMGEQSRDINKVITNPMYCSYELVCLPEELPVVETLELATELKQEFNITSKIYLNKILEVESPEKDLEDAKKTELKSFSEYLSYKLAQQKIYNDKLQNSGYKIKILPMVYDQNSNNIIVKISEKLDEF